ncbi:Flp family type IVb pilin, partial [Vibrio parahaemolyticus]
AVAMSSIILLVFKQGSLQNTLSGAMSKISTSMESANTTEKASEGEKPNS